jgi:hypothetical protein
VAGNDADNIVVAGSGQVYVAPDGTALPASLAALAAPWVNLGYTSDDGATIGISRETEEILAWQTVEAVRTLITSEPKTISFELLQFDTDTVALALRGGTFDDNAGVVTYTPAAAGVDDERAMVIDAVDGDYTFRFCFARVALTGDVEWQLLRTDATRLPLEFGVRDANPPYTILSDHPEWVATATAGRPTGGAPAAVGPELVDESMSRAKLDAIAAEEFDTYDPSAYGSKAELVDAINAARTAG